MRYVLLLATAAIIPACNSGNSSAPAPTIGPKNKNPQPLIAFVNPLPGKSVIIQVNDHTYSNGDQIVIAGLYGNYPSPSGTLLLFASYDGLWTIANVTQNTFVLVGSSWAGTANGTTGWVNNPPTVTLQ